GRLKSGPTAQAANSDEARIATRQHRPRANRLYAHHETDMTRTPLHRTCDPERCWRGAPSTRSAPLSPRTYNTGVTIILKASGESSRDKLASAPGVTVAYVLLRETVRPSPRDCRYAFPGSWNVFLRYR